MEEKQRQQIRQFLDAFLRRKKIILSSLLLAIVAGVGVYIVYPKSYQATALLMYQRQKVSPSEMSPDYKTEFIEIITNLSQQITSRTSLEELINRFSLYPELRKERLVEDIVATMRESIEIVPEREGDVFRISYEGGDPRQVMRVTNALADKFIEENLRFREGWTSGNLAYIQGELEMARKTLNEKEAAMLDYKTKHYNEMPEQRNANLNRLAALQTQYQHLQNSIQELERTKVLIQEQVTLRQDMRAISSGGQNREDLLAADDSRLGLADARRKLAALQGRYTERHPDVVRLKALVRELEKSAGVPGGDRAGSQEATAQGQAAGELGLQIRDIEMNISDLREEMAQVREQIEIYQERIETVPEREAEWTSLTRDYNEYRKYYEELVSRSLEAGAAETLERQQKGSQFRIVDPASFPDKPSRPNFFIFMLVAALAGLGLGGGISFLMETLDTSFKDADDLESYLGLPVTCSIPLIHTESEKQQLKIRSKLWAAAFAGAVLIITSGIITLWYKQIVII